MAPSLPPYQSTCSTTNQWTHAWATNTTTLYFEPATRNDSKALSRLEFDRRLLARLYPPAARRPAETNPYAAPDGIARTLRATPTSRPHRLRPGSRRLAR